MAAGPWAPPFSATKDNGMVPRAHRPRTALMTAAWAMVLFAVLPGASGDSRAEVYRWVDEKGGVHYGERPGAPRDAQRLDILLQGNDPPETSLTCNTIQCQYERVRAEGERLRRNQRESDAAWERELADRARRAERQRQAEGRSQAGSEHRSGHGSVPRRVIRRPHINGRPNPEPPAPATDPGSPLKALPPDGSPVRPLR